jgi:pimeloyl-ACP methyl ester carboxylesterase/DNA-binding SARP family transcriptional activator
MEQGLELTLIGPMRFAAHGEDMPLPASKKTRALLGYLAVADRPVRRDHLISLLWEVPDDPRGALRWSLSKLRPFTDTAGDCRLIADRDTVRIDCSTLRVDWRMMREAATGDIRQLPADRLEQMATLHGVFMEGLELPACDGFQAWLTAMREEVRRWQIILLRAATQRQDDPEQALDHARRWCTLDPFDAIARTSLIELLDRTGRRDEAAMQRDSGIRKLTEAELPVPPALFSAPRAPDKAGAEAPAPPAHVAPAPPAGPPQQVRFCFAADGTGLAWSSVGSGAPLVKTANWLNHLEYDWDSPVWRHWISHFAGYRRVVRYDERGNGLSDWDTPEISFDSFVDDLASVVDAAGLDRFDLFGLSQGCAVSIAYAVRHPERVRSLVLYGGYAAGWRTRASAAEIAMREAMVTLTREGWGRDNPAFRQMFSTLFFPKGDGSEVEWFNELQRICASPDNAIRLQEAFSTIDVRDLLPQVSVPTLVLHTTRDAVVPFSAGKELAARIPDAQFVPLDSDNHLLLESEPAWHRAGDALRGFLGTE